MRRILCKREFVIFAITIYQVTPWTLNVREDVDLVWKIFCFCNRFWYARMGTKYFQTQSVVYSGVRRKFPRGGPKHRRSQGRAKGAMPPPKFVENIVILCFERRFSKQNSVIRLKLNLLVYTAEYWQNRLPKTFYAFFIFRVWGEDNGTVATPFRTLVVV